MPRPMQAANCRLLYLSCTERLMRNACRRWRAFARTGGLAEGIVPEIVVGGGYIEAKMVAFAL
jgi:hypothetical protein